MIEQPGVLSLAGGLPAAAAIPTARIQVAAQRALAAPGRYGSLALQYGPTVGVEALRARLAAGSAAYPASTPGTALVVTTGSQQGLDLIARVLVDPGDPVVVEDPVYLGARQVFHAHGARLIGVPTDSEGMDTERLADLLAGGLRPRLVYCVPNFSNPSGSSLSPPRRRRLAALAEHYGFVIVEDDPYRPLGFGPAPPDPISTHAPDHTVFLGSASKCIAPGLRVGWIASPPWLFDTLVTAKQSIDLHTPPLTQLIVAEILADDAFLGSHLEHVRTDNAARASDLHGAVADFIRCDAPTGGMFLWGRAATETQAMLPRAVARGVAYVPGAAFAVTAGTHAHHLRLSFATLDGPDLLAAADRLRGAVCGPTGCERE